MLVAGAGVGEGELDMEGVGLGLGKRAVATIVMPSLPAEAATLEANDSVAVTGKVSLSTSHCAGFTLQAPLGGQRVGGPVQYARVVPSAPARMAWAPESSAAGASKSSA